MKLSGILDFSMGGFLCIRGFADYKLLANASQENVDVQRSLIKEHRDDVVAFLNKGEYRFFSEVVLSVSLLSDNNFDEVDHFFRTVQENGQWNEKLGDINISIFNHTAGDKNRIVHLSFDEHILRLNRIDGNHRLSVADCVKETFKIPFCLILCRNEEEENQYSRAIFYNINAKQIPLNLEENLRVIMESPEVFSDEILKDDPSFGWECYLTRKIMGELDFTYFPKINTCIQEEKYSFFVSLFKFLIKKGYLEERDESIQIVKSQLVEVERTLLESEIVATTTNIAVIGTLAYYRLTDALKYRGFLSWIKKNNVGNVEKLHMEDIINLYNEIYQHIPKRVFLARWYPAETDPEYKNSKFRIQAIKKVIEEMGLELVDLGTRDTGTFDIRDVMYKNIQACDIFIADLSGARHNVMIEVGYALRHISTERMIFYFQETDGCKSVPFDVNHFSYDKISDSSEIREKIKPRIESILAQAEKGEI